MISVTVFLLSLLVALVSMPLVRKLAVKFGVLDLPGGRKIHKEATPLMGGVAVYLGILISLAAAAPHRQFSELAPILVGATLILFLGLVEDTRGLSAQVRFIVQVLVAILMMETGARISFLPNTLWGNAIEVTLTLLWIVGLINSFNYLDGMDGLAAGSAAINLFFFSVILYTTSQYHLSLFAISLMGACLGFLPYNFRKENKIFLGESGSTLLGFSLACLGLEGEWARDNLVRVFIPILILGVPIFDMIFTTIMRVKEGKVRTIVEWLRYGGKDHFHHYLVDVGLKPGGAVVFIYFITISLGIGAVMVSNDTFIEGLLTLYQAAIIFVVIATLMVVGKRRRSGWGK
ncbi:MAG: MraY family glycosyltransferase [Candidatus Omnitrophica bacterium]|nr:MraY family glycosyltransferase [Candidatus Omnitrophota bacterium]